MPNVLAISVDDSGNSPTGDPSGPDTEVMLDIEVIGSIAPKAQIYISSRPTPMRASWTPSARPYTTTSTNRRSSR